MTVRKDNKFKVIYLLNFAVIILALLSTFTTAKGFSIIWNDKTTFGVLLSWLFAFAVSAILVYCSLTINKYFKESKSAGLISTYVLFAFLSLFFNYNAIYGNFTATTIIYQESKVMQDYINIIQTKSTNSLDSFFYYSNNCKKLDSLRRELKREEEDIMKPGRKVLWQKINSQIPGAEADSSLSAKKFMPYKNQIDSIANYTLKYINVPQDSVLLKHIELAYDNYNKIGNITKAIIPNYNFESMRFKGKSDEPDYALNSLGKLFTSDNTLTSKDKYAIYLSLFIGFLLDFPLFFALVVLNWKTTSFKPDKEKDIFGEEPNNKKNNNKQNGRITW